MNLHFYTCEACGKLIAVLDDGNVPSCCGKSMQELIAGESDGSAEKHVPLFRIDGSTVWVQIGSKPHPMLETHSILWVGLRSTQGFQFKKLCPGDRPEACFSLCPGDKAEAVYAYCNLHGLWMSDKEKKK